MKKQAKIAVLPVPCTCTKEGFPKMVHLVREDWLHGAGIIQQVTIEESVYKLRVHTGACPVADELYIGSRPAFP